MRDERRLGIARDMVVGVADEAAMDVHAVAHHREGEDVVAAVRRLESGGGVDAVVAGFGDGEHVCRGVKGGLRRYRKDEAGIEVKQMA